MPGINPCQRLQSEIGDRPLSLIVRGSQQDLAVCYKLASSIMSSITSEVSHAFRFLQPVSSSICSRLIFREPGNAQQTSRPIRVVSVWPGACLAVG